ncbi:MAG: SLBB domain-containing protein [candidate division KSB1 bacterium]|nr:SLBB domain-containing protein [candidate division KSB1 bacterium]
MKLKCCVVFLLFLLFIAQPIASQDRIIKPGDSIEIMVYGHQELSRIVTVGADGSVDFPFMQNIPVDGMTIEELRRFMVAQLSKYLDGQPVVTVSFTESQLIRVSVLGYVHSPGTVQLPLSGTLQEAVSKAGGPLDGAKMDKVTLIRKEDGATKRREFNLVFLNLLGDMQQNPTLRDQDIVLVTGNPIFAGVKVIGAVNDPGIYDVFYGATVLDMIFKAGGLSEDADISAVRYVSPLKKRSREVRSICRNTTEYRTAMNCRW